MIALKRSSYILLSMFLPAFALSTAPSRAMGAACDKLVAVVPWLHPVGNTQDLLAKAINRPALLATQKRCGDAERAFAQNLVDFKSTYDHARGVRDQLASIYQKTKFDVIGMELTPNDALEQVSFFAPWESLFDAIVKMCPSDKMRNVVNENRLMYFGPEYSFAKASNRAVSIAGMEDEVPFQKTREVLTELAKVKLDSKELLPATQKYLLSANKKIANGETQELIVLKRARSMEKNPRVLEKMDKAIRLLEERDELARERNDAIVRRLIDQSKKHVVVIGKFHEPDLSTRFKSQCDEQAGNTYREPAPRPTGVAN